MPWLAGPRRGRRWCTPTPTGWAARLSSTTSTWTRTPPPRSRWWSGAKAWPRGWHPIAWRSRSPPPRPSWARRLTRQARSRTRPWKHRARCGFPWAGRAGKASSCPSRGSLIVYSSALYQFRPVRARGLYVTKPHRRHAVAQNESFPGRPRGRRARHDGDAPEWQGYDAMPQDQREFPDLAPIRPREARTRDGRAQGGQPGQQPGQPGGGYGGSYPGDGGPGYPPGQPAAGGYGSGQYGGHQGGYGGPAQAPWDEQPRPDPQAAQADTAPPQRHQQPAKHAAAPQRPARRKQDEAPSWAEPDSIEAFSERWHRRGIDSRDEQRA